MNPSTSLRTRKYIPSEIEKKWQKEWDKSRIYQFNLDLKKKKYYNLVEFPYPSGDLHIGHWFAFVPPDTHARFKRMQGFNVFFPNGFDAFGLPAENAAIQRGIHPRDWTLSNIETMTKQFVTMGTMIDWDHKVITCLPEYYKWNQWIFIKMFEKGLAVRKKALSNWCPKDQTVLANEHIENGCCWRCGAKVIQKEIEQWFLKITEYAEDLIWKDQKAYGPERSRRIDWPKSVKDGQNNWIGKSEGIILEFNNIKVYTTRPETTDGATFVVLSPEHELAKTFEDSKVQAYIKKARAKTELERKEKRVKTGVFAGIYVTNPVTKKKIPVWIADYVLSTYGTGAVMAVPGEDERDREFAKKFKLPIVKSSLKANPKGEKKVLYHLRDWSISRQRYWGTPVPMIHCKTCGINPVPFSDLPVELPYKVEYTPKGKPPLASATEWMKVKCPKCKEWAQRDPETLDTFFDSSWYFWRYITPKFNDGPFDKLRASKLMPVDVYFGGAEHTLGHTLYARFFTKFFKDMRLTSLAEFALKRVQHGDLLGPDGFRMSKSRGNVVNPDDLVREYGSDTVRTYLCFMMPYDGKAPFSRGGIFGVYRFLKRVWDLFDKVQTKGMKTQSHEDLRELHKTIKKVGEDLENFRFNTAVSAIMTWLNHLSRKEKVSSEEYETLLKILAPLAPHFAEELYQMLRTGISNYSTGSKFQISNSVHLQSWPQYDPKLLKEDQVTIVVQVNGKLRNTLLIQKSNIKDQKFVEERARESSRVQKYLEKPVRKIIYVEGKIINFVV